MKRMLTMAAAAAVLCTTLCGGLSLGASAADEQAPAPMKLRLMQGFSYEGKAVGDDIGVSGEYKVQVNGPATAKLSESLGALGAANAATFDSEEQTGFSESKETSFEVFYQGSNDLTGLTGWMAYVKMPVNKSAAIPNLDAANHSRQPGRGILLPPVHRSIRYQRRGDGVAEFGERGRSDPR